jgi:drug/metabolite transporter (DMT)-like permease
LSQQDLPNQLGESQNKTGDSLEVYDPEREKGKDSLLKEPVIVVMLIVIIVTWATPNVIGRYLSQYSILSPIQISALRYLPAGLTLLFYCFITKRAAKLAKIMKEKAIHIIIATIILTSFVLLQMYSVVYTSAAASSFLLNVNPIFTFILAMIILKERHKWWGAVGVALSVLGIFFIAVPLQEIGSLISLETLLGNLLALGSGLAWAIYSIYLKKFLKEEDPIVTTTWNLSLSACILIVLMFIIEGWFGSSLQVSAILLTTFMGIFPTAISFTLWFETIKRASVQKVSVFQFLIPVIATVFAIIFLKETINWFFGLGAFLIILGLLITQKS